MFCFWFFNRTVISRWSNICIYALRLMDTWVSDVLQVFLMFLTFQSSIFLINVENFEEKKGFLEILENKCGRFCKCGWENWDNTLFGLTYPQLLENWQQTVSARFVRSQVSICICFCSVSAQYKRDTFHYNWFMSNSKIKLLFLSYFSANS